MQLQHVQSPASAVDKPARLPRTLPRRPTPRLSVPERAARYLAALPPAVAGQGGHNQTFQAACALVQGFGLDEAIALGLLLAHYNPACCPPWSEGKLRHKVRSAAGTPPR